MNKKMPLIVILGPTASGKTSLAIDLAEKYNGEIICADSRTVYKGADIGTAKADQHDQARVKHWGLDLVEPGQYFSAYDFKEYANKKIIDIRKRGKIPFLVGGTGLYIDSVIFDFQFGSAVDIEKRNNLNNLSLEELHEYCHKNNIILPENSKNKRYVIRTIERHGQNINRKLKPVKNAIIIGIKVDRDDLRRRIAMRASKLFKLGVVDEAVNLGLKYGWDNEAMKGNLYRLIRKYLLGEISFDQMGEMNRVLDWKLSKRQLTWFKRNKYINWMSDNAVEQFLVNKLAN